MGLLDQPSFDRAVRGGCPACGEAGVEIRSFIDRSVALMLADPTDAGRWVHDGEKFVDGTYHIACTGCGRVAFESDACPRCHAPGGLALALGAPNRLPVPKRCPSCSELELLAIALVPAAARYGGGGGGGPPKPAPLVEYGEPGYHVVAYACDGCDRAVVAEGCPLCGAPGPLRERP